MATEITRIDVTALSVPGLQFRHQVVDSRLSIICQGDNGAVELLTYAEFLPILGAVAVHSPRPLSSTQYDDQKTSCYILSGGCYSDGSLLAWDKFLPLIEKGDSTAVLAELADWYTSRF